MKAPQWPPVETEQPERHPNAPGPGTLLGQHYSRCFGCGDEQEHGLHLKTTTGEDFTVYAKFTVTEAHQGAPGLAHGGLLACAFDEALGTTVGHLLHRPAVTGRLRERACERTIDTALPPSLRGDRAAITELAR